MATEFLNGRYKAYHAVEGSVLIIDTVSGQAVSNSDFSRTQVVRIWADNLTHGFQEFLALFEQNHFNIDCAELSPFKWYFPELDLLNTCVVPWACARCGRFRCSTRAEVDLHIEGCTGTLETDEPAIADVRAQRLFASTRSPWFLCPVDVATAEDAPRSESALMPSLRTIFEGAAVLRAYKDESTWISKRGFSRYLRNECVQRVIPAVKLPVRRSKSSPNKSSVVFQTVFQLVFLNFESRRGVLDNANSCILRAMGAAKKSNKEFPVHNNPSTLKINLRMMAALVHWLVLDVDWNVIPAGYMALPQPDGPRVQIDQLKELIGRCYSFDAAKSRWVMARDLPRDEFWQLFCPVIEWVVETRVPTYGDKGFPSHFISPVVAWMTHNMYQGGTIAEAHKWRQPLGQLMWCLETFSFLRLASKGLQGIRHLSGGERGDGNGPNLRVSRTIVQEKSRHQKKIPICGLHHIGIRAAAYAAEMSATLGNLRVLVCNLLDIVCVYECIDDSV